MGRLSAPPGPRVLVPLAPEEDVEAELVGVRGELPHLQASLVVVDAGGLRGLGLELHVSELPPGLQAALREGARAAG